MQKKHLIKCNIHSCYKLLPKWVLREHEVKVKVSQGCPTLCDLMSYSPWDSPGQYTGMGSLSLLRGIMLTQGSNPGLPHCRWILYQLSHKGRPGILEWVACPFSSKSSQPRNQTSVSCIVGRFFTNWPIREALWGDVSEHKSYDKPQPA